MILLHLRQVSVSRAGKTACDGLHAYRYPSTRTNSADGRNGTPNAATNPSRSPDEQAPF
jgi:hypothetical protein